MTGTIITMTNDDGRPEDPAPNGGESTPEPTPEEILALLEADLRGVEDAVTETAVNSLDECLHDWFDLGFTPSGSGFSCAECGQLWNLDDGTELAEALMTVWNAAKLAIDETQDRVGSLEALIAAKLDVQRCDACNTWADDHVELGHAFACDIHVGDVLAAHDHDLDDDMYDAALVWAGEHDLGDRSDLEAVVVWERLVSGSTVFASIVGEDEQAAIARPVELHPILAEKLGLPEQVRLGDLTTRLAAILETDIPTTRQGMAFLLAMLWSSVSAPAADSVNAAATRVVERSVPLHEVNRMNVAVDICGHGMPDGTTFAASMANQVLTMVAQRAAVQLLSVLHGEMTD